MESNRLASFFQSVARFESPSAAEAWIPALFSIDPNALEMELATHGFPEDGFQERAAYHRWRVETRALLSEALTSQKVPVPSLESP